jgi:predicted RNase H-like HicB family nuclease
MRLTIELDREIDGRWIAEVPELNVLLYGDSEQDAIQRVQSAAREIVMDRIAHGELSADAVFDVAAYEFSARGQGAAFGAHRHRSGSGCFIIPAASQQFQQPLYSQTRFGQNLTESAGTEMLVDPARRRGCMGYRA